MFRLHALGTSARRTWQRLAPQARALYSWAKEPALVVIVMFASTTAIAAPFYVPSGSMEPTLQIGDGLIATKFDYGYSRYSPPYAVGPASKKRLFERLPERGDIVLFRLPSDPHKTLIKRLIGLPGDRVQMRHGHLWINGKKLPLRADGMGVEEGHFGDMIPVRQFVETLPNGVTHRIFKHGWDEAFDNTPVYVVPKEHLFVMGDNRDDSADSRVPVDEGGTGFVPMENLVGHAAIVVGSFDFLGDQPDKTLLNRIRSGRFLSRVY
jgi:signal peptidase I